MPVPQLVGIDSSGNLTGSANSAYQTSYSYYPYLAAPTIPTNCGTGTAGTQAELLQTVTPPSPLAATSYVYDSAGRGSAVTDGAGTTCTNYSSEGRMPDNDRTATAT